MAHCKSGGPKKIHSYARRNDWPDRCYYRSFLCAIESIVLCAFICKVGYFDAQIRETLLFQVGGLTHLPL
jgi:hypothetical protein